jgi:hypothetical protein
LIQFHFRFLFWAASDGSVNHWLSLFPASGFPVGVKSSGLAFSPAAPARSFQSASPASHAQQSAPPQTATNQLGGEQSPPNRFFPTITLRLMVGRVHLNNQITTYCVVIIHRLQIVSTGF